MKRRLRRWRLRRRERAALALALARLRAGACTDCGTTDDGRTVIGLQCSDCATVVYPITLR